MQSDGKTTKYFYNDIGSKVREEFDIYKFYYLNHGELYQVKVSNVTTVSYSYDDNYNLTEERYANDDVIRYKYNANGDVVSQYHNSNAKPYVTYTYNADNELTEKVNTDTGLKYVYGENNQVSVYKTADNSLVQSYTEQETEADEENGVEGSKTVNEIHFGTSYSSVVKDKSVLYSSNDHIVEYSYQTSGKEDDEKMSSDMVKSGDVTALSSAYTYDDNGNVTKKSVTYKSGADTYTTDLVNTYDNDGRITSYGYESVKCDYTYDENSQLVRSDNRFIENRYTVSYSYDERGNITSKKIYDYTSGSLENAAPRETTAFTYANSGWKDQLVSVNGVELTYDANGNVLTYGDREYLWNTGRHLASITDGDNEYTYTYDENGIRTSKTVNDNTTYYNTKDGVILSQTDGTNTMYFQYDNSGTALGFIYNGVQYFYLTNTMGDVLGITEANGNLIAQYLYDDWGKLVSIDTADAEGATAYREIAEANPLRYCGYYYDSETGYYYLQSRYYDPEICRFINADDINYIEKDYDLGLNIFIYCNNNPLSNSDIDGYYSAARAKAYAERWWDSNNPKYDFYRYDCANFVSQCLYAGGLSKMTGILKWGWHHKYSHSESMRIKTEKFPYYSYEIKRIYNVSYAWSKAQQLYDWLKSSRHISNKYTIKKSSDVDKCGKNLYKKGACVAAVFFDYTGDGKIDHAAISGEVIRGGKKNTSYDMYYYAHTDSRNGKQYQKNKKNASFKDFLKNNKKGIIYVCILK